MTVLEPTFTWNIDTFNFDRTKSENMRVNVTSSILVTVVYICPSPLKWIIFDFFCHCPAASLCMCVYTRMNKNKQFICVSLFYMQCSFLFPALFCDCKWQSTLLWNGTTLSNRTYSLELQSLDALAVPVQKRCRCYSFKLSKLSNLLI